MTIEEQLFQKICKAIDNTILICGLDGKGNPVKERDLKVQVKGTIFNALFEDKEVKTNDNRTEINKS